MYFNRMKALSITSLALTALVISRVFATMIVDPVIHFRSGKPFPGDSLEESVSDWNAYRPMLENAASQMMMNPKFKYRIIGTTDNQECLKDQCRMLSLRRAQYVYDWLLAHGARIDQLASTEGYGDFPVTDNNTDQGRSLNRRVEIDWIPSEPLP